MPETESIITTNKPVASDAPKDKREFLQLALERFAAGDTFWQPNYRAAAEDLHFAYVDQWDGDTRRAREGSPCLTLNKLPTFLDQIIGDQRQNRPSISVHPVEANRPAMQSQQQLQPAQPQTKAQNVAGTKDYSLAEVRQALIRNIEYTSGAETHYDIAAQHQTEAGIGWLRVYTKYADDSVFDQDLVIGSIKNRFSVIMDPHGADEPDFSNANWCFISQIMRRAEFNARFPGASPSELGESVGDYSVWMTDDTIRVSEYFWREPVKRKLLLLSDKRVVYEDEVKPVLDELAAQGVTVVRERVVETHRVMWALITANSILVKPQEVPFDTIPVIPVLGKEVTIDRYTVYRGLFRYAKDAQVMHNVMMSEALARVGLAPKAPYILDAKSIEGFEPLWANANRKNWSYLPYNHRLDVPPPRREQPPQMPAAEMQLALAASDELKAVIGLYDASLGNEGNETSGKAIVARQRQGDRGTFAYVDNQHRAIRRIGKLLLYAIPRIYDSERIIRLKFADNSEDWVLINQTILDQQTGTPIIVNDIAEGKYDVVVTSGPSYQTQRMEAADSIMAFVQAVPAAAAVIMDLVAKNMDWPGADEIAKRLKKVLPAGTLDPQELQEEGIEPPQPTPEQQVAAAQAQADIAKAKADEALAQAKTVEAQAKIMEIQAAAAMAGTGSVEETIKNLVADALAEFIHQSQGQKPAQ
ncbi:MAG: hypothetical protein HGB17_00140 [Syntrophobacteraceae bacterium]|nr:hypothetical protein [Syntrophobacteraceae bacterium]